MNAHQIIVAILLWFGVISELLCCLGAAVTKNAFDRLHFTSAGNIVGPAMIAAAVIVDGSSAQAAIKPIFITVVLLVASPIITHVIARAARVRETGELRAKREEIEK
jgi:monovalent cation/proton antiporter MnhG/PhaG subunit